MIRKKGMVKISMAEENTVGDKDDEIMSEDAGEEKEGPQALNTTSRQLRYYYSRKLLERMPQHRTHRAEALQSIILSATPTSRKAYKKCENMVKTNAPTKRSLVPEFKGMVMDRDVGRKISSNHALRIKRKCKKIFKNAPTKRSLVPEFKGMVMDRDVGRKISSNHALRIKRKCKKIFKNG